jgi:D-ribose pyranose/furanose isomerase RbsD
VILIGTNVSVYTSHGEEGMAHWKGLLKDGLQRCEHFADFNDKFENNIIEVNNYLLAADHTKTCLSQGNLYRSWLREKQGVITARKPEFIQAIGDLGCPVLTTNYDLLLEDILKKKCLTWDKYYANHTDESIEYLEDFILHLYGYFPEPDSVIFTPKDYDRLHSNRFARAKLRDLLNTRTLLFIGYGRNASDPIFSNLLKRIFHERNGQFLSIYQLVKLHPNRTFLPTSTLPLCRNIREIPYGNTVEDLLVFIQHFKSFTSIFRKNSLLTDKKRLILKKYLHYIIAESGHVSIFGYSNTNLTLPLDNVYVELKFDPTHPSIKAMKTLEVNEEFKRKLLSPEFFTDQESKRINQTIFEKNPFSFERIYRDLMVDQWLDVLLNNRTIFTASQAYSIKRKITRLKEDILEKSQLKEVKQYQIQEAYNQFKHFVIVGHPGSGKTTISKWLAINMAK